MKLHQAVKCSDSFFFYDKKSLEKLSHHTSGANITHSFHTMAPRDEKRAAREPAEIIS